jgi:hypothetical protein
MKSDLFSMVVFLFLSNLISYFEILHILLKIFVNFVTYYFLIVDFSVMINNQNEKLINIKICPKQNFTFLQQSKIEDYYQREDFIITLINIFSDHEIQTLSKIYIYIHFH